ncbi:glycoside hydrolase family 104 protein [Paraburkholderia kururiensis]|uniref:glycoside hydrolase family 24 protein n=1 Tax=Paraburkholderia kururiensis TaxID=984307 RepID=UPI00034B13F4|nr:glycoside hydrolase family 104 protein [Paraburkholderia kururiensis]
MPRITPDQAGGANRCAFLDMIGISEGTVTDPVTQDDGYDILVTGMNGPQRFASYADHPDILVTVNTSGLQSTAAGRYQLLHRYWVAYKAQLNLPDFSPVSQDLVALQQIRERGALPHIDAGNFAHAVLLCSNIWASLPGNGYGQHQNAVAMLQQAYVNAGGALAA